MFLEILTPDKTLFSGEVIGVKLPGSKGSFEVLKRHASIVSRLDAGKIRVKTGQGVEVFEIQGGVIQMMDDKVVVLA